MHAPDFWHRPSVLGAALAPLGLVFQAAGAARRVLSVPYRLEIPVICVGNLVAGGAGKTPVALALANLLRDLGVQPHFLTRGYGGSAKTPVRVDPAWHVYHQVGDEALLLAEVAPTWVARDRVAGAKCAVAAGAGVIVMDDGFQNPSLKKDLSFLAVDGGYGVGNGRIVPAGPLRESIGAGLARAQAVILIGDDVTGVQPRLGHGLPVILAALKPVELTPVAANRRVLGFAGIGRPSKFFESLREAGANLVETREFPDHHPYSERDLDEILARAAALNAVPITTAKDWVRVPAGSRGQVLVFRIALEWQTAGDETVLRTLLQSVIAAS